ncbi:MAG: PstS family phosphate ABC transporter substrate-binding protein [Chitinophagales bacterium]|nr:PstS family phosphate ABC transporter substrate-binding protein [Chitinophagales bacterium]
MNKIIVAFAALTLLNACNSSTDNTNAKQDQQKKNLTVSIDGSSTVYPISEAVAEEYGKQNPDLKVTIAESGTGGGMKKFSAGEIDICDASRPIKKEEADACAVKNIKYIELPIAYDGLSVVVNPKNTWVDKLTVAELKKIWSSAAQGKITSWNQVRPGFPNKAIKLFGPGTDSGTFDYFCEVINGKRGDHRGDYTASEDDNILVQGVSSDEGAIGYFGLAYYEGNSDKLKLIPIDDGNDANGKGAILPTLETVQNGTYAPLSRALFLYANTAAESRQEVKDFLSYYLQNVPKLSKEVGYIPLQDDLYPIVTQRLQNTVTGSLYTNGEEMGTTLEGLLKGNAATSSETH